MRVGKEGREGGEMESALISGQIALAMREREGIIGRMEDLGHYLVAGQGTPDPGHSFLVSRQQIPFASQVRVRLHLSLA